LRLLAVLRALVVLSLAEPQRHSAARGLLVLISLSFRFCLLLLPPATLLALPNDSEFTVFFYFANNALHPSFPKRFLEGI